MTKENITQKRQEGNAPFVAIKWADTLRLENDYYVSAGRIQLYPVIATFQINGCYLSQDKYAAYAGMRKADVKPTILNMIEGGWLNEDKNGKTYRVTTQYDSRSAERFYMIGSELVINGIWGELGQTRQVIYSILQAFSKHSAYIDPYWAFSGYEKDFSFLDDLFVNGKYPVKDCSYLKLEWYKPDVIIKSVQNCKIDCSKKTFQRVIRDLLDWGLMFYVDVAEGYFFPRKPGLKAEGFEERLKKIEAAQKEHSISYAAKRAAIASEKRQSKVNAKSKFITIS